MLHTLQQAQSTSADALAAALGASVVGARRVLTPHIAASVARMHVALRLLIAHATRVFVQPRNSHNDNDAEQPADNGSDEDDDDDKAANNTTAAHSTADSTPASTGDTTDSSTPTAQPVSDSSSTTAATPSSTATDVVVPTDDTDTTTTTDTTAVAVDDDTVTPSDSAMAKFSMTRRPSSVCWNASSSSSSSLGLTLIHI